MRRHRLSLLILILLSLRTDPGAADVRSAGAASATAERAREASAHAQLMFEAREAEFMDRLLGDAAPESCKYVSSISTRPPANRVALTFDDGPDPINTPYVLDVLRKYGIKATFFMTGVHARANSDIVRRVVEEGHLLVGNHSWNHPNFHGLSNAQQDEQILRTRSVLDDYQPQKYFRYPYGNSTCYANARAHQLGYRIVGWHVDSCDWGFAETGRVNARNAAICEVKKKNVANFVDHVVESLIARKGGILLMHETQTNTIRQLEEIVEGLVKADYAFGMIDEPAFESSMR